MKGKENLTECNIYKLKYNHFVLFVTSYFKKEHNYMEKPEVYNYSV